MTRTWRVELAIQKPLSLNARHHWSVAAKQRRAIRDEVRWRVRQARIPHCAHVRFTLHFRPSVNRRRDTDSLVGTSKPALDGLVNAGVIDDDTPEYVDHVMPCLHAAIKGQPPLIWLEVEET